MTRCMTDELQPLGGKKIIQRIGYVFIVLGFIVFFSEHIVGWPVFGPGQAVSATSAQNKNGGLSIGVVSDLQARLSKDPAIYPEGIVSGIYGELTRKAVMRFQKKYQLAATGAADAVTLQRIHEVFALPSAPVKTSAAPSVKKTAPAVVVKPKADSIIVHDQFDKAVSRAKVWFVDNEGRQFPSGGGYNYVYSDDNGRIELSYVPKVERYIPDGNYTIHISKENYSPLEMPVEFKTDESIKYIQVIPHTFTVQKRGVIAAVLVDPLGEPMSGVSIVIVDTQGKSWGGNFSEQTGRVEMPPLPDGQYVISTYPSQSTYEPFQRTVSMEGGKDMFLGNITVVKK